MSKHTNSVYYLNLPADSRLTRNCRTHSIHLNPTFPSLNRQKFEPSFLCSMNPKEKHAWFHWITGHQHLLFYWTLTAEACLNVAYFVQKESWQSASLWLRRAAKLMLGSASAVVNARNVDPFLHNRFVKIMLGVRPEEFIEESFNEYCLMKGALDEMEIALSAAQARVAITPSEYTDALRTFTNAKKSWFDQLSATKYSKQIAVTTIVPQPSTQGNYDQGFGILRVPMMFVEDFHYSLRYIISDVQKDIDIAKLGTEGYIWIEQGDELMTAITEELLDPPTYHPDV